MLFWGIFSLCAAVIVFAMTLLGARHPGNPKWASGAMVQYVWVIAILGFAACGVTLFAFAFAADTPAVTMQDYLWSLAVVVGTGILIKLLGIKKKLAAYAAGRQAA